MLRPAVAEERSAQGQKKKKNNRIILEAVKHTRLLPDLLVSTGKRTRDEKKAASKKPTVKPTQMDTPVIPVMDTYWTEQMYRGNYRGCDDENRLPANLCWRQLFSSPVTTMVPGQVSPPEAKMGPYSKMKRTMKMKYNENTELPP